MFKVKKMTRTSAFIAVIAVSFIQPAQGGGKIEFDLNRATAKIKAEFRFFGEIRPEVIKQMMENMEKQWSGLPVRHDDTTEYKLYLVHKGRLSLSSEFTYSIIPTLEEAKKQYRTNTDTSVNFVRMVSRETHPHIASSSAEMGDYGGGSLALFTYGDRLEESTTAAHEFGHLLGLGHAMQRHHGRPRMMIERGSPVADPEYSYDPTVRFPLLNPYHRRVHQEDVNEIAWKTNRVVEEPGSGGTRGTIGLGYIYELGKAGHFKPKASGR